MDLIKGTIEKTLQDQRISLSFLDEDERFPCPHGTMVRARDDGKLYLSECSLCVREHEEKKKAAEMETRRVLSFNSAMWEIEGSEIPKRFANKTFKNYNATSKEQRQILKVCEKFAENFNDVQEKGTSLVFCGRPGTGKTHLAYSIISTLRARHIVSILVTASDMTSTIKDAFKKECSSTIEEAKKFANYPFLAIDEVGVQVSSDAEKRIFFDVINKRYENMLPTLLISNLELQELTGFVGERVMDRMRENGGVVFAFDWRSSR